jgi:hypothetical protein
VLRRFAQQRKVLVRLVGRHKYLYIKTFLN